MQGTKLADDVIVDFDTAVVDIRATRLLRAEAASLRETYGCNPYSDFVSKKGCRPDRSQASAIGRLMGVRVRAADGSMQPSPSKAEQTAARAVKDLRKTESDYIEQILRFRCALANLAENSSDPADVIRYMDPLFGDVAVIRRQLAHAVQWINRFAEEWCREQETHGGQRKI